MVITMLYDMPQTLSQIRNKLDSTSDKSCADTYQLLTIEGDDFTQIRGLTEIAEKILVKYPKMNLYISSNAHDFGTYYGLEICELWLGISDIEDDALLIAEELGYEI